ncbi:hypothetical protein [Sphingobacterium hungaricum]|nr:hypothetical protein [Sphingobacterium hungaricum]
MPVPKLFWLKEYPFRLQLTTKNYRQQKQQEYAAKFASEQGGNIADDVEF